MLHFNPKNQMKLRHQSSTPLKKFYKWAMDSNSSWFPLKGTQVLVFLGWAPSFSGICCSPLNASACASERCEMVTETSVRGTDCGNVKFRKWHDDKVQQKEQWRPGDHFPLPKIFMSLTTAPDISKITGIGLRDKAESQWLQWSIGQMPLLLLHICAHHCAPLEWLNPEQLHWPYF